MTFTLESLSDNPLALFAKWYSDAENCKDIRLPECMCVSTISPEGYPDGRTVLLKHFDDKGFVFYTNLNSPKGDSLRKYPTATLIFYWDPLRKQVRITGEASIVSDSEADAYFQSRPRQSQIGAWASKQSEEMKDPNELQLRFNEFKIKFEGKDVPRPPYWSGYCIKPARMEFWEEKPHRLHDRFLFILNSENKWSVKRLYP